MQCPESPFVFKTRDEPVCTSLKGLRMGVDRHNQVSQANKPNFPCVWQHGVTSEE
jgi:hypothetical protein